MSGVGKNGLDQPRMIQNGIANFRIAQKIDQRNTFAARAGERAHDEIKIGSGKPSPTIRPDHRNPIMSKAKATGKVCAENLAEGVGFEPTVGCPTLDFESSALNRTQPPFQNGDADLQQSIRRARPLDYRHGAPIANLPSGQFADQIDNCRDPQCDYQSGGAGQDTAFNAKVARLR